MSIDVSSIIDESSAFKAGYSLTDNNPDFCEVDPSAIDPNLVWHFIRGYFEGNSLSINNPRTSVYNIPRLFFYVVRAAYLEKICNFLNMNCYSMVGNRGNFVLTGTNALDLLGKLYENHTITKSNVVNYYYDWCRYCVSVFPSSTDADVFSWCKTREDAVAPSKERVSDSGFDLTIVDVVKKFHNRTTLFTTGIKVKPAFGWYLDVVPRSSIIKSGYMLANNVGIIDRAYTGEIMIALIKVDDTAPDLELPCRIAQMIPRRIAHVKLEEVTDIERTTRNEGGFGSTG